jgi:PIN domain nuclease of toxin-antitoxin system
VETGALIAETASKGLSLGDRACLALARVRSLPAVTADRSWSGVDVGVQIQLIR